MRLTSRLFILFSFIQEYEAAIKQMDGEKVRMEQEERRKTLAAETEQHQKVVIFHDRSLDL